jgi:DNA gyrase/topoisomerase IV subunit B
LYKAADVDPIVQELLGVVEESLNMCKRAKDEAAAWRKKAEELDSREKVTLEKVASLDPEIIDQTLDSLQVHDYVPARDKAGREKMAKYLQQDPNNALLLAQKIIQFSARAPEEGRGVAKVATSGTSGDDYPIGWHEDGWDKILREGA